MLGIKRPDLLRFQAELGAGLGGSGGTFSTGSGYALGGTASQPDTGLMVGGGYTLGGGFWGRGPVSRVYRVYLPLVLRQAQQKNGI